MAGVGAQASARETAELTMKAKAEDKITIRHFQARMPYGLVVRDIDNR